MLVLAAQLASEGHAITFTGPPTFRASAEARGLAFVPLKLDSEAVIRRSPSAVVGGYLETLRVATPLFVASIESQLEVLPELAKHADFILAGGVPGGAATAAEVAGIPWRWVLYTSTMYPSLSHPPMTAPFGRAPRWVNWLLWQLTHFFTDVTFRPPINKHRVRLGLPKITHATDYLMCPNPILAMEPELAPLPPEWPDMEVIGYLDPGDGEPLPDELETFLAAGEAPVYVGFGSMPDPEPAKTTELFAEASRRAGVRAVISRGWADFGASLPEHCIAVGPVSHPRLFSRVRAIVHHGGAGTTAASTRAGRPQLVVPHVADQFYFGNLVHELGVAVRPLRRRKMTVDSLAARLRELVGDAAMYERANALGERIRARPRAKGFSHLLVPHKTPSTLRLPASERRSSAPRA